MNASPTSLWEYISRSTMKREFAALVFLIWLVDGIWLMHRLPTTQFAPDAALAAWGALSPYMFALVTMAFGADFVAKQTTIAGPPQGPDGGLKIEVQPQDVKVDGVVTGTINVDEGEAQKANG